MNENKVYTTYYQSLISWVEVCGTEDFITSVLFVETEGKSSDTIPEVLKESVKQLDEYFTKGRKKFDLPLKQEGTLFQQNVWKRLQDVPYGETMSYLMFSKWCGNKNLAQATGNANAANVINIIIPCHRIIGSNGRLKGYRGGLLIKDYLINMEKENSPTQQRLF